MTAEEAYGALKNYIKRSLAGMGALEGAPCKIESIIYDSGINTVTFSWKDDEGTSHTSNMLVHDGATGATGAQGAKGDKGDKGNTGDTGNGIASIAKTGTSGLVDTYTITMTNGDTATFTVTNGDSSVTISDEQWNQIEAII